MMPFSSASSTELSLFDPENLHHLELLRKTASLALVSTDVSQTPSEVQRPARAPGTELDRIFDQFKIRGDDRDWQMGTVDIDVIHRGRMRIATGDWPPLISYCRCDATENGIVKQFRLHVLRHATDIRLIYGTYRFKLQIAKAWTSDYRCGKLLAAGADIRESMVNLAYWLTAQPHAQTNFTTWETLIDEALVKLSSPPHESDSVPTR
jgi:hypothetical protein